MIKIYTDGSSRGNPGAGGWGSIALDEMSVVERGGREDDTTNNRMELMAVISSVAEYPTNSLVTIYTDSAYVLNGAQSWLTGWKKNGWKTSGKQDVLNKDLWQKMDDVLSLYKVSFIKVKGHSNLPLNERADEIATSYADNAPVALYSGLLKDYFVDISDRHELFENLRSRKPSLNNSSSKKAYSYVSSVNGEIMTHSTWAECEARVKGTSKARYKKSFSTDDEKKIIEEFKNIDP